VLARSIVVLDVYNVLLVSKMMAGGDISHDVTRSAAERYVPEVVRFCDGALVTDAVTELDGDAVTVPLLDTAGASGERGVALGVFPIKPEPVSLVEVCTDDAVPDEAAVSEDDGAAEEEEIGAVPDDADVGDAVPDEEMAGPEGKEVSPEEGVLVAAPEDEAVSAEEAVLATVLLASPAEPSEVNEALAVAVTPEVTSSCAVVGDEEGAWVGDAVVLPSSLVATVASTDDVEFEKAAGPWRRYNLDGSTSVMAC